MGHGIGQIQQERLVSITLNEVHCRFGIAFGQIRLHGRLFYRILVAVLLPTAVISGVA